MKLSGALNVAVICALLATGPLLILSFWHSMDHLDSRDRFNGVCGITAAVVLLGAAGTTFWHWLRHGPVRWLTMGIATALTIAGIWCAVFGVFYMFGSAQFSPEDMCMYELAVMLWVVPCVFLWAAALAGGLTRLARRYATRVVSI